MLLGMNLKMFSLKRDQIYFGIIYLDSRSIIPKWAGNSRKGWDKVLRTLSSESLMLLQQGIWSIGTKEETAGGEGCKWSSVRQQRKQPGSKRGRKNHGQVFYKCNCPGNGKGAGGAGDRSDPQAIQCPQGDFPSWPPVCGCGGHQKWLKFPSALSKKGLAQGIMAGFVGKQNTNSSGRKFTSKPQNAWPECSR